ncbi:MAG: hypothetical protein ACE5EN_11055 [Nitrospinota bacterium]
MIFAAAALIISSCATMEKTPPIFGPAELVNIAAANPYRENIVLKGYAALKGKKGWVKSKAAVLVRRPDSMRVTLLDPAGLAWFVGTVNKRVAAYAAPAKNLYKKMPSTESAVLKIGRIKLRPFDLIRFIHPGLQPAWLEDAIKTRRENRLLIRKSNILYKIDLNEKNLIVSLRIERKNVRPVRYVYRYGTDGGYSVEIDRKIRFEFSRIQTDRKLPDSLFDLPAFP